MFSSSLNQFGVNLAAALACGAAIGIERQWRQRNAGLHTCTLVSIGAALFVSISVWTEHESSPTRVAAQVVAGVGFLCAGTIMRSGLTVRGLNTAGTLWCSAAIGTLAGLGLLAQAALGTIAVVAINIAFRPLANLINRHPASGVEGERLYLLTLTCRGVQQSQSRQRLVAALQTSELRLHSLETAADAEAGATVLKVTLAAHERMDAEVEKLAAQLSLDDGVTGLQWSPLLLAGETGHASVAGVL